MNDVLLKQLRECSDDSLAQRTADEIEDLQQWVSDCQSGMYINCVYCGHRYGPREETPVAMADVLKEHCEQCPKHPLSAAKAEIRRLHQCAAFFRCCALSGEATTMTIEEFEVSDG